MDICYNYSPETGEYLGQSAFRRDPLENLPMIPAYATEDAPPSCTSGWIPVWSDGAWSLVEDHRGEAGYVFGEAATISVLGGYPDGWSALPPLPNMDEARAAKLAAIQAEKNRVRDGGFPVGGVLFDSDAGARLAYLELENKLAVDQAFTTSWKASDGVWVTMDAMLYAQVKAAGTAHISACFAWQAAREAEVAAAQTIAEVEAVSAVYGG